MAPHAGVPEHHGPAGRAADVSIHGIFQHFFDLFSRDAVVGTVLHIAIGNVVRVPEDRFDSQGSSASVWNHNTTVESCGSEAPTSPPRKPAAHAGRPRGSRAAGAWNTDTS